MTLAGIAIDKAARSSGFAQQNCFPSPLQVKRVRSNLERKRAREGAEPRADARASSTASEVELIRAA